MNKIPEGFRPPPYTEMAELVTADERSSLVAKVSAVASSVGLIEPFSGDSLAGRVNVCSFQEGAERAWKLCELKEFPDLEGGSAQEQLEALLKQCPEDRRAELLEKLACQLGGARIVYDIFESCLQRAWQEVFPGADFPQFNLADNLQKRIFTMLRACHDKAPADQARFTSVLSKDPVVRSVYTDAMQTDHGKRLFFFRMDSWLEGCWQQEFNEALPCRFGEDWPPMDRLKAVLEVILEKPVEMQSSFIKALCQDRNAKIVYEHVLKTDDNLFSKMFLAHFQVVYQDELSVGNKESQLFVVLQKYGEKDFEAQSKLLQQISQEPLLCSVFLELSYEERKRLEIFEQFEPIFLVETADTSLRRSDNEVTAFEEEDCNKTGVLFAAKNSLLMQSNKFQLQCDAGIEADIMYEKRETEAAHLFAQMLAFPPEDLTKEGLFDYLKKELFRGGQDPIDKLWTVWKLCAELQIPREQDVFLQAADDLMLAKMNEDPNLPDEQFIQVFVRPMLRQVSQVGNHYRMHTLSEQPGYRAIRQSIHQNMGRLLNYCDTHPGDWQVKQMLSHMQSVKLPRNTTDIDLQRLCRYCPLLTHLNLTGCVFLSSDGFRDIKQLKFLEAVDLSWCHQLGDGALQSLYGCTNIRKLDLSYCRGLNDNAFQDIGNLRALKDVDLSECHQLGDRALQGLCECGHIRKLNLRECRGLRDAGFQAIKNLQALEDVDLSECHQLGDGALQELCKCKSIRKLNLRECRGLRDAGFEDIGNLQALKDVLLSGCNQVGDEALQRLCGCTNIRKLDLIGCRGLSDNALQDIGNLQALEDVDLSWCNRLGDEALQRLCGCKNICKLSLRGCSGLSDNALQDIGNLQALEDVDLSWCNWLGDEALQRLCGCTNICKLSLRGCSGLGDAGFENIGNLQALEDIDLGECNQVGDVVLQKFCKNPHLRQVNLQGCKRVTSEAKQQLKQVLPTLTLFPV